MMMNKKTLVGVGAAVIIGIIFFVYSMESTEKNEENEKQNLANTNSQSLKLIQTIQLPNVSGRIDHMDIDTNSQRLFVAELENNSLDVIDLKEGKRIRSIDGLREPQGVVFVPDAKKILVTNGADGTIKIFDPNSYSLVKTILLSSDADNIRYDSAQKLVYVGYGNGGLAVIDPEGNLTESIKLDGHPESFQISDKLQRIFVNVPEDDSIEVIDMQKNVLTKWPNNGASGNYPMVLDEDSHRLFVVYRQPSEIHVIDTDSGQVIAKLAVGGDPDDIFYDGKNRQIYVSGGQGFIDVISIQGDIYQEVAKIPTDNGARTSLFVPQLDRLYVAVPDYSGKGAEIQVFETQKIQ